MKSPGLIVDAGNALFRAPGLLDDDQRKRAAFIVQTMAELGTVAMAVGPRDLNAGGQFLLDAAKGGGLKLLSANLREGDRAWFEGSTVVTVAGTRVGLIGVSPPGPTPGVKGFSGLPVLAAVRGELDKLKGKVDLVVVLAACPYADALQTAQELKGQVDLVLQSGDARQGAAQKVDGNVVISSGERGRTVGQLELNLAGKGAWVDLDESAREKELLKGLDLRVAELERRLKLATDAAAKKELQGTLSELQQRQKEQARRANAAVAPGARTLKLTWLTLDANVGDDPELKKKVMVFEPTYAAPH